MVKKWRTHDEVVAEYCRTETGGHYEGCGAYSYEDKLDVMYVPQSVGERIVSHLQSAYGFQFYKNLSQQDLFHAHPMAYGPQTQYATPEDYFSDLNVLLYHAFEYISVWPDIPLDQDPFAPHAWPERSFVGWISGDQAEVKAAIDLVTTGKVSNSYYIEGTVSMEEVNESQHFTQHPNAGGSVNQLLQVNTCGAEEQNCEPCGVFPMVNIFEDPQGRFMSPDGKRFEAFVYCKYLK